MIYMGVTRKNMKKHETIFGPELHTALKPFCARISMELLPFEPLNSLAESGCQEKPHFPEDMAESKRCGTKQKTWCQLEANNLFLSFTRKMWACYSSQNPGGSLENVGIIRKRGAVACSLPHVNSKNRHVSTLPLGQMLLTWVTARPFHFHLSTIRNPNGIQ